MPSTVENKISMAGIQLPWQKSFTSWRVTIGFRSGIKRRHHHQNAFLQTAIRQTGRAANLTHPVAPHTRRHSFAPLTCMAMAPIFGPFKSCSAMPMSLPS
jgi:hypothetical protein